MDSENEQMSLLEKQRDDIKKQREDIKKQQEDHEKEKRAMRKKEKKMRKIMKKMRKKEKKMRKKEKKIKKELRRQRRQLQERPTSIHNMTPEEYDNFVIEVHVHLLEHWSGIQQLLIQDVRDHIKGIIDAFRTSAEDNPEMCVANAVAGDVQAKKTPVIVLIILVVNYIRCNRKVLDDPRVVVVEDMQSSRDAMKPKLQRLLQQYSSSHPILVATASDPKPVRDSASVIVCARTAYQIGKMTPEDSALLEQYHSQYLVFDEADKIIGSCEGRQEFEKALETLLLHSRVRGVSFITATMPHVFGFLLSTYLAATPRVRLNSRSIQGFVPTTDPKRHDYVGLHNTVRFQGKYLQDSLDGLPDTSTFEADGKKKTFPIEDTMAAEVNRTPYAMMLVRSCTGVNPGPNTITMQEHACQMEENLKQMEGHELRDAFQIVIHGSGQVFKGSIGVRTFGPNSTQNKARFLSNCPDADPTQEFVTLDDLLPALLSIEQQASASNEHYVRTINRATNGTCRLSVAQLPLLIYYIRNLFPGIPIYVIGNTVLNRSLSVVSVDPFTDGQSNFRVMACITHVFLNIRENSKEVISKNHSDTVQLFLRFATTLKQFHIEHGFTDANDNPIIPVLAQKDVWDIVQSNQQFNEWIYANQGELVQRFQDIREYATTAHSESDDNETLNEREEMEENLFDFASRTLRFDTSLEHFFQGKNWGHRRAERITFAMARLILIGKRNSLIDQYGQDSVNVQTFLNGPYKEMFEKRCLEKKRKGPKRNQTSNKRSRRTIPWSKSIPEDHVLRTNPGYCTLLNPIAKGEPLNRKYVRELVLLPKARSHDVLYMDEVVQWYTQYENYCRAQGDIVDSTGEVVNVWQVCKGGANEVHAILSNLMKLPLLPTA